jgi:peroxiredoxin (alkyl hydroperoxide reductase subunit C)
MIGVGQTFPDLHLIGVEKDNTFVDIDVLAPNMWTVIYFYPKDFTFICPTEIAAMDIIGEEADVIGVSGDNEFCKVAWKTSVGMIRDIQHILAADCGLKLASELGIVDKKAGVCLRATYIIDPDGVIQHVSVNALDTGRNAEETLRTLQALKAGGLTGCDWQPGEDFVA